MKQGARGLLGNPRHKDWITSIGQTLDDPLDLPRCFTLAENSLGYSPPQVPVGVQVRVLHPGGGEIDQTGKGLIRLEFARGNVVQDFEEPVTVHNNISPRPNDQSPKGKTP